MLVFVDELEIRGQWRYGASSHLLPYDSTPSAIEALHALALKAGLKRSWYQDERWKHYDCASRLRSAAVAAGAVEIKTKAWMHLQKFLASGKFKEPEMGLMMELGKWYILSDSDSFYSPEGYLSAERAVEAALSLPGYDLELGEVEIQGALGGDPLEPFDNPALANVVKADSLLLFHLLDDYFPFVQSQREPLYAPL